MSNDKRMSSDFFHICSNKYLHTPMYERLTSPCNDFSAPNWFQSPPFAGNVLLLFLLLQLHRV